MAQACPALRFQEPSYDVFSKTASLQKLLEAGANIVMSHQLLTRQHITAGLAATIREYGYTLMLDEVLEVVVPVGSITRGEVNMLFAQGWIAADEKTGVVRWLKNDEKTLRFKDIRDKARGHTLIWYDETLFLWLLPIELLRAFPQAYVLTFMFLGSHLKHYLDLHGVEYSYAHVKNGVLLDGLADLTEEKAWFAALLDVYDRNLNDIGEEETSLSKSWVIKSKNKDRGKVPLANARNVLMNRYKAPCNEAMWTAFKDDRTDKPPQLKGYQGAFCPCNARATNEYRERDCLAYLVNVYDHPYIIRWFADQGIKLDPDAYALSQLLQWLWRSAIRDGKPVRLYLPSRRMRRLLLAWLGKPIT